MVSMGQIPIQKIILNFGQEYNPENLKIKKLVENFPKEWILLKNKQYLPLQEIEKHEDVSRKGKILNTLLESADLKQEEIKLLPTMFYNTQIGRFLFNGGKAEINLEKRTLTKA